MRDRIEVRLQIGIHHLREPLLDQTIEFPQRIVTPAPRTEAVAPIRKPMLEDRLDHKFYSLLDNAILDRRDPNGLVLPSPLGMSTRLTAWGRYDPSRNAADSSARY